MFKRISILLCTLILACCHSHEKQSKEKHIITAYPRSSTQHLYYNGVIKPLKEEVIISPSSGVVSKMFFHYGDFVKKGDLLFTLHSPEMESQFREAISNYLRVKQANLNSKKSMMGTEMLHKEKIISEQEYESEKSQYQNNMLSYVEASNKLKLFLNYIPSFQKELIDFPVLNLEDAKKLLQENIEDLAIYAKTSGIILFPEERSGGNAKQLQVGSDIKRDDILLAIGDLTGLSVTANVTENDINHLTTGLPVILTFVSDLELDLHGKIISAREALKLGLVDAAVPKRVLKKAACHYALNSPEPHKPNFLEAMTNHGLVRSVLAKLFYHKLREKIREDHYPAPFAIIRNWEEVGPESHKAMEQEAKTIAELMIHPTGRNLLRVFFLKERLKSLAKGLSFKAHHVHVIGAGTMGSGIAAWCVLSGLTVTLQDTSAHYLASGIKKAYGIMRAKLKSHREVRLAMDRLNPDVEGRGLAHADVVIEAISESLEAKHALYHSIEKQLKPYALLATNTSSLPLTDLSQALTAPERLVGIHFFNPVDRMELVEVVSDYSTDPECVQQAIAFVKQINRLPLPVQSKPGFLVNRILMPYLLESMRLIQEGVPAQAVDAAAKEFGMPMGPIELADRVGLDVCLSVAEILTAHLGGDVPNELRNLVAAGKLGTKSGEGFYRYFNGKKLKTPSLRMEHPPVPRPDIIDRLIFRMLNEAAACLREGIVSDSDLLDAGMIFGTGFAPFRGGPMHYAKTIGVSTVRQRLDQLASHYGERFLPDAGWQVQNDNLPSSINLPAEPQSSTEPEQRIH